MNMAHSRINSLFIFYLSFLLLLHLKTLLIFYTLSLNQAEECWFLMDDCIFSAIIHEHYKHEVTHAYSLAVQKGFGASDIMCLDGISWLSRRYKTSAYGDRVELGIVSICLCDTPDQITFPIIYYHRMFDQ